LPGRGGRGKGGRGGGQGGPNRGRGHGRGRGGTDRQNRGGDRGGRGSGKGKGNAKTGYYTDEEWNASSQEQRDSILEARGTKRNIAKVETEAEPEQDQNNSFDGGANTKNAGGAGDGFGRKLGKRSYYIGMMHSSPHKTCNVEMINHIIARAASSQRNVEIGENLDLDSHANTSVIGANCRYFLYRQVMPSCTLPSRLCYYARYTYITGRDSL
jgi:hypothetical protein